MLRLVPSEENAEWIDVVDPSPEEIERLARDLSIPAALVGHSLDLHERPRVLTDGRATLVVLKVPSAERAPGSTLPYSILPFGMVFAGDRLVTICPRDNEVLARLRRSATQGMPPHRLALHVLEATAETYLDHLSAMNGEIDAIEERLSTSLGNREVMELLHYQKSLIYYATALRACELMLEHVPHHPGFPIPKEDEAMLANVLAEFRQALDVATLSGNILGEMMDAFASIISNNLNSVMKFLASVAVILTVPVVISSFYGMNVALPGQRHPAAFIASLSLSLIVSLAVALLFRRRKWL